MARKRTVASAQDTVIGAARTSAKGVRNLAGDAAETVAKAATGTVLTAIRGARRLVAAKPTRKKKKRRSQARSTKARKRTLKKGQSKAARKTKRVAAKAKRKAARKKK